MLPIVINVLLAIHVLVSLLIILLVLMQRPKNEGLGAAFGGGMTENLFGAQTTNVLQTITRYLGAIFFALTLLLSFLYVKQTNQRSSISRRLMQSAAPVLPTTPAPSDKLPAPAVTPEAPADQKPAATTAPEAPAPAKPAETMPAPVEKKAEDTKPAPAPVAATPAPASEPPKTETPAPAKTETPAPAAEKPAAPAPAAATPEPAKVPEKPAQ